MIPIIRNPSQARLDRLRLGSDPASDVKRKIALGIIRDIEKGGDRALFRLTRRFDRYPLNAKNIRISEIELGNQSRLCPEPLKKAIRIAARNIRSFHARQISKGYALKPGNGIHLAQKVMPLESVGLYIPGGFSPLFSTILMTVIPAQLAGVRRIVAVTPPKKAGLHPAMAFTFRFLGIKEIYRVGGAQAIAALAIGTKSIQKVDKIAGPGSRYVAAAKKELFGRVNIDMDAGPSEICIIADRDADPSFVARDLLSQAEHGTGDECVTLFTDSSILAAQVQAEVASLVRRVSRGHGLHRVLANRSLIAIWDSIPVCLDRANGLAPEHLELMVRDPFAALKKVRHAGSVFLGAWSCESLGDYFAGPNHVLPTGGTARFSSPVGVYDFVKRMNVLSYDRAALEKAAGPVARMAEAEGLPFHAEAARFRAAAWKDGNGR